MRCDRPDAAPPGVRPAPAPDAPGTSPEPGLKVLDLCWALLLSLAVYALAHAKALSSPFVINDDLRQQIYWMQRWIDPELYPPDLLNAYAEAYVPWGVKAVYWLGSWIANPVQFTKAVAGALFAGQCLLLMALGSRLGGRPLALGALAAGWLMPFFLDNIAGGLSRGFASPALAAFALAWLSGNARWLGGVLLAQALLIPYIFLPCALAVAAERLWARLRGEPPVWLRTRGHWLLLAAGACLAALFSLVFTLQGFGPLVTLAEASLRPEFGPRGRLDLAPLPNPFLDFVYFPFEGVGLFKELGLIPGIASLVLLAWPVCRGALRADWRSLARRAAPLGWMAGSFLLFYVVARAVAFRLFVPDRYVQYPLNLLYALGLAACLTAAWRAGRPTVRATAVLMIALSLLGGLRLRDVGLYDLRPFAAVCAEVEVHTPKNALLAGHPDLMDNVLIFARRNALATTELAQPWSAGYWDRLRPRLDALFAAYYARDPEAVRTFAREFSVDFLVVDAAHFTPGFLANTPFFEPFGQAIKDLTQGRTAFALLDPAAFPRRELTPGTFLVDLR